MRTTEERITALHQKMQEQKQARERRKTALLGAGCGALAICLLLLTVFSGGSRSTGTAGIYSGATILFENAGGYVLAAVAAFMLGVVGTSVVIGVRKRKQDQVQTADRPSPEGKKEA